MPAYTIPLPPLAELQEYLRLDAETGKLFWIKTKNTKWPAGREAATCALPGKGYKTLGWNNRRYLAHRIIYLMANGVDPGANVIDHINGNVFDNRPANLRVATLKQNSQNVRGPTSRSKTGVLGVHWSSQNRAWCAKLTVGDRQKCRFFKHFDDAVSEIAKLRKQHYGEYAGGGQ